MKHTSQFKLLNQDYQTYSDIFRYKLNKLRLTKLKKYFNQFIVQTKTFSTLSKQTQCQEHKKEIKFFFFI